MVFFFTFGIALSVWGLIKNPELMKERRRVAKNVEGWDKVIMGVYSVLLFTMFSLAGLDFGRFRWSSTPLYMRVLGWLCLVIAGAIVWWSMSANPYLSRTVRIQEDRGHWVVTTGPYQYVRHPMYVGTILFVMCIPLLLGSWWALIPGTGTAVLFIIRTALEDCTLKEKLPGYKEYAEKVRYRLLHGIW